MNIEELQKKVQKQVSQKKIDLLVIVYILEQLDAYGEESGVSLKEIVQKMLSLDYSLNKAISKISPSLFLSKNDYHNFKKTLETSSKIFDRLVCVSKGKKQVWFLIKDFQDIEIDEVLFDFTLNQILYGPPGVGKTYTLQNAYFGKFTENDTKYYKMVTFHQNFSYEDFVEGIKPNTDIPERLQYKLEQGIFYKACQEAVVLAGYKDIDACLQDTQAGRQEKFGQARPYAIFIDEVNRANVSSVFGELITLIEEDKRLGNAHEITDIILPYSKKSFGVPANLYIICTMNTADRSVEALDTALRRRFTFIEMMPDYEAEGLKDKYIEGEKGEQIDLPTLLRTINERLALLLDTHYAIGHSYFLPVETFDDLKSIFKQKIIPLLQEYFLTEAGKINLILGNPFIQKIDNTQKIKFAQNNSFANKYALKDLQEREIYKFTDSNTWEASHFIQIYTN